MDAKGGEDRQAQQKENTLNRVRSEVAKQAWIIFPLAGFNVVLIAVQLVSIMFVGHLGTLELSSAAIATSLCNVSGFSLVIGLAFALDTLCGQAHGAKQYHKVGVFIQQAVLVLALICIPVSLLWINLEPLLLWCRQDPEISAGAQRYARRLVPGLFAYTVFEPMVKFFQTQSRVLPLFWSSILALLCHILLCWIFTYKLGMGNAGAAVSLSITYWLLVFFLVTAAAASPTFANYWHGFTTEAFHGISQFLKLAIPSALMVCLEWWAFEVLILFSGVLPNPALQTSVLSIVMGIINLWMIPSYGISAATSVRTSNELGAGNPLVARFAFRVAVLICLVYATLAMLVLLLSRNVVGHAFSSDSQVVSYVGRMIPFASGFVILSALHSVGYGVASGCGWQSIAALGNIGAYYVVGLPLSYVLGFVFHLRVEGLLSGSLLGFLVQALVFFVAAFSTNWEKRALQARDRLGLSAPLLEDQI
ncbi:protein DETOXIFICATION 17 isoform X1 [Selaginella moellendorffii]|uniref:protein DETOXIFICATION 17 isoform X1 n=1 Tax=Selaginella moellendorffii TaxID=88036 RepID=UPI000D1CD28A|nr:protein DETOXIFICATION 17 isoform X1 [Selaginella moellendorffii]|eukprot:XP_024536813.1 protein DETOXIFICATION 17 isoform X1 [Selaginella moellendorffii]